MLAVSQLLTFCFAANSLAGNNAAAFLTQQAPIPAPTPVPSPSPVTSSKFSRDHALQFAPKTSNHSSEV